MKLNLIFMLLLTLSACEIGRQPENLKFNRDEWVQGDRRVRGRMVNSIIDDSILIGKSKSEVTDILGDYPVTTGNLSYPVDIGLETGPLGLGGTWLFFLNVHFDSLSHKVDEVTCRD